MNETQILLKNTRHNNHYLKASPQTLVLHSSAHSNQCIPKAKNEQTVNHSIIEIMNENHVQTQNSTISKLIFDV